MVSCRLELAGNNLIFYYRCTVCEECGRSFIQKSDLGRHELIHKSSFDHICTWSGCDKRFKTKKNMRNHLKLHNQDRKFQCDFCSKRFRTLAYLNSHLQTHQDVKKYKCNFCDKGFVYANQLNSHLNVHKIEKPFQCPVCNKNFKRKSDLTFHCKCYVHMK